MITMCPRGDTTLTYMPAIIGELVLGAQYLLPPRSGSC